MKRIILLSAAALSSVLLLASCAGVPRPEGDSDTLVVGSLVVDYPDGFYNAAPRKIDRGIRLDFVNVTKGTDFFVITSAGGYFSFLTNGSDHYELKSFSYDLQDAGIFYRGGGGMSYKFDVTPHCVQYIGHLTYTLAKPRRVEATGARKATWQFDPSIARVKQYSDIVLYLQDAAKDSVWNSYTVKADFPD